MASTEVRMGEYAVAKNGTLTGTGIGSCLLICLYDPKQKIGGMAHAMLPAHGEQVKSPKFADCAIPMMLADMEKTGARRDAIEARIVGGAKMFEAEARDGALSIGNKNIKTAKETLDKERIPIIGEDTGGMHGRSVEFDVNSGVITVKTVL